MLSTACDDTEKKNLSYRTLEVQKKIADLQDSVLFGSISDIDYETPYLYLSDYTKSHILKIDRDLNLVDIIGVAGDGPGEIRGASGLALDQDDLFVLDEYHSSLKVFDKAGNFKRDFKQAVPHSGAFVIKNGHLIGGKKYGKDLPPLFSVDLDDTLSIKRFGSHERSLKGLNEDAAQTFHVVQWKDEFITIAESDLLIQKYNANNQVNVSLNLTEFDFFQDGIRNSKEDEKNRTGSKGVTGFMQHPMIVDNKLYLLAYSHNTTKQLTENVHLLVFILSNDAITPTEIIRLNNEDNHSWYASFTIFDDKILAFDALSYELHQFQL